MATDSKNLPFFTREEVAKHASFEDQWLVMDDKIYNITNWYKKHPGGKVITFYRGEDATEVITAFHPNMELTKKYMAPLLVGQLTKESYEQGIKGVVQDFRKLRADLEKEGRFKSNPLFYFLHLLQLVVLEIIPVIIFKYAGVNWATFLVASIILACSQAQAGWNQHDFGHLAVIFKNRKLNQFMHHVTIGVLKGASSHWWKNRHNRHHAKTNVVKSDPDIHTEPLFVWGEPLLKRGHSYLPYQHVYWWIFGPPTVTTFLFVIQNIRFVFIRKLWVDLFSIFLFFLRFGWTYSHFLSGWNIVLLYLTLRFWETHWFTWVTSMSHLPRPIRIDQKEQNWVAMHSIATQNIVGGPFHDWFTGHLNYQIEHHLFPTMPRHQLPFVATRVQQLCEKHGLPYHVKSMYQCCRDILDKLVQVGALWEKTHSTKSQ